MKSILILFSFVLLTLNAGNVVLASEDEYQDFKKACDGGDMWACYALGDLERSDGNRDEAKKYYKKACDGGHYFACSSLGFMENGEGNWDEARNYYGKACDLYASFLMCPLVLEVEAKIRGGGDEGYAEVKRSYQEACLRGTAKACRYVGVWWWLLYGDYSKANEYYKKACDGGDGIGCDFINRRPEGGSPAPAPTGPGPQPCPPRDDDCSTVR